MTARPILAASAALFLVACGDTAPLKPAAGQSLPVKPALAQVTPDAEDLLRPAVQAAPERVDELVTRSLPRESDRFDLPPPDGGAAPPAPAAEPESEDEKDETRVGEPQ